MRKIEWLMIFALLFLVGCAGGSIEEMEVRESWDTHYSGNSFLGLKSGFDC